MNDEQHAPVPADRPGVDRQGTPVEGDPALPPGGAAPGTAEVLDFWFGPPPLQSRPSWFRKDPDFDAQIRARFGALIERALDGTWPAGWGGEAADDLARVLVLDQFTRNVFRASARAFAGDAQALTLALGLVDAGRDRQLPALQRWFVYLPLEHAEDLAMQDRSVGLFDELAREHPELAGALDYAQRHREVIARFGRFPHRNDWLGRTSTEAERAYLAQPGSGF